MPTLAATVAALEKYCGFAAARTRQVARRLLEDKLLTPGGPGIAVEITEADFALLLLGVASGASMPTVADVVVELVECLPRGVDVNVKPEGIRPQRTTAFDVLHDQIWNHAHGDGQMRFDLEVVEIRPEVVFHGAEGAARFCPAGSPALWQSEKQRRSTRIPHSALFLAARNLFGDKN